MFFSIKKSKRFSVSEAKTIIKFKAKKYLICHNLNTNEVLLNNYLLQNYRKSLKNICLSLAQNASFSEDKENNLIITFKNKEQNELAELITYGNLEIQGSQILRLAFGERT